MLHVSIRKMILRVKSGLTSPLIMQRLTPKDGAGMKVPRRTLCSGLVRKMTSKSADVQQSGVHHRVLQYDGSTIWLRRIMR